ncbi:MAG TPA: hypothetical protein VK324_04960 [Tepidisphaeraceae bacterium]|nr:hypothetical protein [Tepidisphaeraceae bacterium]
MLDWYTYTDDMISVRLPARFKRSRAPTWLFKGRLRRLDAGSQLVVSIQTDVPAGVVESLTWAATNKSIGDPKSIGEWMGATWTYRYSGVSRARQGGVEAQITQHGPPPGSNFHRWHILYPDRDRWVFVDVFSAMGSLPWDEFEDVTSLIMNSVRLIDNEDENGGESN